MDMDDARSMIIARIEGLKMLNGTEVGMIRYGSSIRIHVQPHLDR